jgi:hypothetical protein
MEDFVAFYLVERYVPSMTTEELAASVARLDAANMDARHVGTVLVGGEDTCLSLFEAEDAGAVETANEWAGFHFDRVVPVTPIVTPAESGPEGRGRARLSNPRDRHATSA